ncbi:hypothetical protein [Actinophytocola sp.]|jgi:hypothetical protein|uniref:hypothetical protein n=1 Tax=Actinophytocola sp. TaxID=1872138 RepID=UPI002ED8D75C
MSSTPHTRRRAAAFDVRLIIALLLGVYGLVTTVLGLAFTSADEIDKSAGININLWAGLGMLVVAALFTLWTMLRPLRVPEEQQKEGEQQPAAE